MNKEVDIADLIAGELQVSRGTAYDLMRKALEVNDKGVNALVAQQESVAFDVRCEHCGGEGGGRSDATEWRWRTCEHCDGEGFVQKMLYTPQAQPAQQEPVCIDWDIKTDTPIMGYTTPQAQPIPTQQAAEPVAVKAKDCDYCGGTGTDGDVDDRGQTIDVQCGMCAGSGKSRLQLLVNDTQRLDALAENCWDLRSFGMPTGAGDADVGWRVVEFHMAKPSERTVVEVFLDDPRQAIDAAIEAARNITGGKT